MSTKKALLSQTETTADINTDYAYITFIYIYSFYPTLLSINCKDHLYYIITI